MLEENAVEEIKKVQADFVDERLYEYPESDRGSCVTGYNVLGGFG